MRNYAAILCLLLSQLAAHAQYNSMGYFRMAEKLFAEKQYYAAAQYYEKYLTVDKKARPRAQPFAMEKKLKGKTNLDPRQEAIYHLSIACMQEHDYIQAEKWSRVAAGFPQTAFPESQYWFGKALLANGKYDEATEAFTRFEKEYTEMGPILQDADRELANLRFIQQQAQRKDRHAFILTRQTTHASTSAYALTVRKDDTLVYTSIHRFTPVTATTGNRSAAPAGPEYKNDLYEAVQGRDTNILASSALIPTPADTTLSHLMAPGDPAILHNGLPAFSADGKRMFFTRWTKTNGLTHAAIWSRQLSDSGWSSPELAEEPINTDGYNSTQPSITGDGKYLLFASDRPGGQGKYDLWYAPLDTNYQALYAANLGEKINTPGDEASPYYHQDSRTLIFASDGRAGMGGYDIYYTKGNFDLSRWEAVHNPGIPINSSKDDLYFISTDPDNCWNTGWLSSDRESGCCLALYTVRQDNHQYISGTVLDCDTRTPLPNVKLTVTDERHKDQNLADVHTDSLGVYHFQLNNTSRYQVSAKKKGYMPGSTAYLIHMETGEEDVQNPALCLQIIPPPPPNKELEDQLSALNRSSVLGNFPYKRSALPRSAYLSLDSLAALMDRNPASIIQVEGYTDGIGGEAYNIRLAQARVDACIRYLVKKGIARTRLRGKSFGKCCPIAPDTIDGKDNPAGREMNRRVEYRLVR